VAANALTQVREAIVACDRCARLRSYCIRIGNEKKAAHRDEVYWARPVPGFGDPRARLLVVGLAPAAHGANRTGRVFTGDGLGGSGDFLMRAMHAQGFASLATSRCTGDGLRLIDAYITATVRCAPPDNKPLPTEIAACHGHLVAELAALRQVQVFVTLGRVAFDATWRLLESRGVIVRPRPAFAHGATYEAGRFTVIASYHPSRQNTNTGKLTEKMLEYVFKKARKTLSVQGSRFRVQGSTIDAER